MQNNLHNQIQNQLQNQFQNRIQIAFVPCLNEGRDIESLLPDISSINPITSTLEEAQLHDAFNCPLSSNCSWFGRRKDILLHCQQSHINKVFKTRTWYSKNLIKLTGKYLIYDHDNIFFLFIDSIRPNNDITISYDIQYLWKSNNFINFAYHIAQREDPSQSAEHHYNVIGKYCDELQFNPDNMIHKNSFKIVITETPIQNFNCRICNEQLLYGIYLGLEIWSCIKCNNKIRSCANWFKGCRYVDYEEKCLSHTKYFCNLTKKCHFCFQTHEENSLMSHYHNIHDRLMKQTCIKFCDCGSSFIHIIRCNELLFVVEGRIRNRLFEMLIYSKLPSYVTKKMAVYVKLKDPFTQMEYLFPATIYHHNSNGADWKMGVNVNEFTCWSGKFTIHLVVNNPVNTV